MKRLLAALLFAAVMASAQVSYLWQKKVTEGDLQIDLAAFRSLVNDKGTGQPAYTNLWGWLLTTNERCNAPSSVCTFVVSVRWTLDGAQQPTTVQQLPATKWPKYENGEISGWQQGTVRVAMRFPAQAVIQDVSVQVELRESLAATTLKVEEWKN